jgi:2-phospho-L-lactate/phosphoenolpyruvate guanylyltransferase
VPVPIVPVKALADAKSRLAGELDPIARRLLTIAMFEDVVAALQATAGLGQVVVVSPDREMWRRAEAIGCRVVEEPPAPGLNASLARAAATTGTEALLVVAADLPLATPASLARVVDAAARAAVVVVPSHDGAGTNLLAWQDSASFAPAFGAASAERHLAQPGALRLDDADLALDVDTVDDLHAVAARLDRASVTARRLRDLEFGDHASAGSSE